MQALAAFGVRRPVVANLLMYAILAAGLIFGLGLTKEFLPEVRPNQVIVTAPFPGQSPEEIEEALAIRIEDRLADLTDVVEIASTVTEGAATIRVEYRDGVPIEAAVAEVKREVDALQDLPEEADRIVVEKLEPNLPAVVLSLYGDGDQREMKEAIREIRDDLRSLPGMGDVVADGVVTDEISVEVRPSALLRHNLSLAEVAGRVNEAMRELPAGSVRAPTSNTALRSEGIDERAGAVREIVVRAAGEGQALRLEDVAEVKDSFADVPLISRLNGVPGVNLTVFRKGDEDVVELAEMAKAYVAGRKGQSFAPGMSDRLMLALRPPGSTDPVSNVHEAYLLGASKAGRSLPGELDITTDLAKFVVGRLDLLTRNAFFGGILVFATLVLLLNWRVSFWVAAGLVISLAGTLVMMRMTGLTLNLLTMFGLIVVLGILVDDAIVVAENITARHEKGEPALVAAVRGTKQVGWPVVATVLTTICAFAPLGMVGGDFGDILSTLPLVVACALLVSLIESLFILPSHMGHSLKHADHAVREHREGLLSRIDHRLDRARTWFFDSLVTPAYTATLKRAINAPYTTTAIALAAVIAVTGLAAGKRVEFIFFETNDAETVQIDLQMPIGTPLSQTDTYARRIEAALDEQPEISNYFTTVGSIGSIDGTAPTSSATHLAQMILELVPVENRDQSSEQVINSIRRDLGDFAGIKSLRMQGVAGGPGGPAISLTVSGERAEELEAVSREIMDALAGFRGVVDISSDSEAGQRELRFRLRDGASELGFTRTSLGQQLQAFSFGIEAFTFAGERENVDVRVMLPERERRSLAALERQFVFTPDGTPVPLAEVAEIEETTGYSTIRRFDRERSINVTADVDRGTGANPEEVAAGVRPAIQEILARYPGVTVLERGRQEDFSDAMSSLPLGFLAAAGLIYVILAWLFGSYTQPLVVMSAIPFAVVGVILGHLIVGIVTTGQPYAMTFLSLIGFVALAGIVVNDSLIFMEFYNHLRREGMSVREAAMGAGRARVRAILLTTITTVFGLLPLMLEQSFQARFLIPMAITVAFGLISATGIILIVLPCLLVMTSQWGIALRSAWAGTMQEEHAPTDPDAPLAALDAAE